MSKTIVVALGCGIVMVGAVLGWRWWSGDDVVVSLPPIRTDPVDPNSGSGSSGTRPKRHDFAGPWDKLANDPRPSDRVSQADFDAAIDQLDSADATTRAAAKSRMMNWPGDAYDRMKAELDRQTVGPQALAVLRAAVPRLKTRHDWLQRTIESYQYDVKVALESYAKTPAPPGGDAAVRKAIMIGMKPALLREAGESDGAVLDAAVDARDKGYKDPLVTWLACRAAMRLGEGDAFREDWWGMNQYKATVEVEKSNYPESTKSLVLVALLPRPGPGIVDKGYKTYVDMLVSHLPAVLAEPLDERTIYARVLDEFEAARSVIGAEPAYAPFEKAYVAPGARPATDVGPRNFTGSFLISFGWEARGYGFADTVTEQGWQLLRDRLGEAGRQLTSAWKDQPDDERAARQMMTVAMASKTADPPRAWFDRAMAADPDDLAACQAYMQSLLPRWSGTHEAMVQFGRECLAGGNWRAEIPWIIIAAHEMIGEERPEGPSEYLAQPAVWADYKAYYEGYLAAFPDARGHLNNYAKAACDAKQWDDAKRAFARIGDVPASWIFKNQTTYDYYRKMAETGGAVNP